MRGFSTLRPVLSFIIIILGVLPAQADSRNCTLLAELYGNCKTVAYANATAYAGFENTLVILDLSDPATLTVLSSIDFSHTVEAISVAGPMTYVVTSDSLSILDTGYLAQPRVMSTVAVGREAHDLVVVGTTIYVAVEDNLERDGLLVIDGSDPAEPREIGFLETSRPNAVTASGTMLYLATWSGMQIIDAANPNSPEILSTFGQYAFSDVTVSGALVCLTGVYSSLGLSLVDVSDPQMPVELGTGQSYSSIHSVAMVGSRVYAAAGLDGLKVLDVSDPEEIQVLETHDTPGSAVDVSVNGSTLCLAGLTGGLQVLDIGSIILPEVIGHFNEANQMLDLTIVGPHAYVACGDDGLIIYNIEDPARMRRIGHLDTPGSAKNVATAGSMAYVADSHGGLRIIDVSDPESMREVAHIATSGNISDVIMVGSMVYYCDNAFDRLPSIKIVDMSDPLMPQEVGMVEVSYGNQLDLFGNILAVTSHYELILIDVEDPAHPTIRSESYFGYDVKNVDIDGDLAYLIGDWLTIVDVSDPDDPEVISNTAIDFGRGVLVEGSRVHVVHNAGLSAYDVTAPETPQRLWIVGEASGTDVALDGSTALVAGIDQGLVAVGFEGATSLHERSYLGIPGGASNVEYAAGLAYVAAGEAGLQIVDVSDPDDLILVGSLDTPFNALDVAVEGNTVVIADAMGGMVVVEVSDPTNPLQTATIPLEGQARGITLVDGLAYVANPSAPTGASMYIVDVHDPENPVLVHYYVSDVPFLDVEVSGDLAFVASTQGLITLDVSVPVSTHRLDTDWIGDYIKGMAFDGTILYVACDDPNNSNDGLRIYDVSDPRDLIHLSFLPTTQGLHDVAVHGTTAYLAEGTWGMTVADVQDPETPSLLGVADTPGLASGIVKVDSRVLVADGVGGLRLFDAGVLVSPEVIGNHRSDNVVDVEKDGQRVFLADARWGLRIFDITDPSSPRELADYSDMGGVHDVEIVGPDAYIAVSDGLGVIDISNIQMPVERGRYVLPENESIDAVTVVGTRAYVVGNGTLSIIDMMDPTQAVERGELYLEELLNDVKVVGGIAYVTSGGTYTYGLLSMVDVSDPDNPVVLSRHSCSSPIDAVSLDGSYAYLATRGSGLRVLDLSNILAPRLAANYQAGVSYQDVVVDGDVLYLGRGDHLEVLAVDDPANPRYLGLVELPEAVQALEPCGQYLAVADGTGGLLMVTVRGVNPVNYLGDYSPASSIRDLSIDGSRLAIVDPSFGLKLYDVTDPGIPRQLSTYSAGPQPNAVASAESMIYIGDNHGLTVLDASDPSTPQRVGELGTADRASLIAVDGTTAYVWIGTYWNNAGLEIIDVGDPANPVSLAFLDFGNVATSMDVQGPLLFATLENRVSIVDVADPTNPTTLGTFAHGARSVAVSDTVACVIKNDGILSFYGIANPHAPVEVAYLNLDNSAQHIYIDQNLAYVTGYDGSLQVVDFSNPLTPNIVGFHEPNGSTGRVVANGMHAYLVINSQGFQVVRYDPAIWVYPGDTDDNGVVDAMDVIPLGLHFLERGTPRGEASLTWRGQETTPWDVPATTHADADGNGVVDGRDLVAIGLNWGRTHHHWVGGTVTLENPEQYRDAFTALYEGIQGESTAAVAMRAVIADMLDFEPLPRALALHRNAPNPFNPATTIKFDLPAADHVTLRVFDLQGRVVAELLKDHPYRAGYHQLRFEPRGLGSGVYIYRLETSHGTSSHKMTLLK